MNKEHFLISLKLSLKGIPVTIIEGALEKYEALFDAKLQEGKSEEEVSKELGNPSMIAEEIFEANHVRPQIISPKFSKGDWIEFDSPEQRLYEDRHQTHGTVHDRKKNRNGPFTSFLLFIMLSFFNLVVTLAPIIIIVTLVVTGWISAFTFTLSPFIGLFMVASSLTAYNLFQFFASLILCGIGLLIFLAVLPFSKYTFKGLKHYILWNIKVIRGGN